MKSLRNHRTPYVKSVRALESGDLEALREPAQRPTVLKIRDAHHNVARLLALGLTQIEVAAKVGYSIGRVNQLAADPSIQELVASYREMVDESYVDEVDFIMQGLTANVSKAVRQTGERLDAADEDGAQLSIRELMSIASDGCDRVGYGKRSMNVNINMDFAAKLELAIARSKEVQQQQQENVE